MREIGEAGPPSVKVLESASGISYCAIQNNVTWAIRNVNPRQSA